MDEFQPPFISNSTCTFPKKNIKHGHTHHHPTQSICLIFLCLIFFSTLITSCRAVVIKDKIKVPSHQSKIDRFINKLAIFSPHNIAYKINRTVKFSIGVFYFKIGWVKLLADHAEIEDIMGNEKPAPKTFKNKINELIKTGNKLNLKLKLSIKQVKLTFLSKMTFWYKVRQSF